MTAALATEWVVLASIALEPDAFTWEAAGLDPLLFTPGETRVIAEAIARLVARDRRVHWRRIRSEAKRAGVWLSDDAIWNLRHGLGTTSGMHHYLGELVARRRR